MPIYTRSSSKKDKIADLVCCIRMYEDFREGKGVVKKSIRSKHKHEQTKSSSSQPPLYGLLSFLSLFSFFAYFVIVFYFYYVYSEFYFVVLNILGIAMLYFKFILHLMPTFLLQFSITAIFLIGCNLLIYVSLCRVNPSFCSIRVTSVYSIGDFRLFY